MSVADKIKQVMELTGYLQKDGQVAYGNTRYSYLSEEKITNEIRNAMLGVGLILYPVGMEIIDKREVATRSGTATVLNITARYRIQDVESGEHIDIQTLGEGMDNGDKTVYKAMTGAFKYAQRQTFMIPTGDDPDKTASDELVGKRQPKEEQRQQSEEQKVVTQQQATRTMTLTRELQLDSAFMAKLIKDEFKKDKYGDLTGDEVDRLNSLLEGMKQ